MTAPIALQLYTIRETLAQDFAKGVERIAGIGYAGVETAGFPGTTPEAAAHLFKDLGLAVAGAHLSLPTGEQKNQVLDTLAALGCRRLICPYLPPEHFQTERGIHQVCEMLNDAQVVAEENGISIGYHNHWWEFYEVNGRLAHDIQREYLKPSIFFEIDTYWVKTAGADPVAVVRGLGRRAPLLHIKDGPCVQNQPMVAVGAGEMDIRSVIQAGDENTEWLIVELDACATDMVEAVEKSYRYLVDKGLGHGNQS